MSSDGFDWRANEVGVPPKHKQKPAVAARPVETADAEHELGIEKVTVESTSVYCRIWQSSAVHARRLVHRKLSTRFPRPSTNAG